MAQNIFAKRENKKEVLKLNISSLRGSYGVEGTVKVLTVKDEYYSKYKAYYHNMKFDVSSEDTITGTCDNQTENKFAVFDFNVTEIIIEKIKNKENSVTFVIQLNNDEERDQAYVSLQEEYGPQLTVK